MSRSSHEINIILWALHNQENGLKSVFLQCTCFSVVLEAMHEVSQGSETETRELLGVTEENSVSRLGIIDLPSRQINDFFTKKETEIKLS